MPNLPKMDVKSILNICFKKTDTGQFDSNYFRHIIREYFTRYQIDNVTKAFILLKKKFSSIKLETTRTEHDRTFLYYLLGITCHGLCQKIFYVLFNYKHNNSFTCLCAHIRMQADYLKSQDIPNDSFKMWSRSFIQLATHFFN